MGAANWLLFAASSNQDKVNVFYRGSGGDDASKVLVTKFTYDEYCAFVTDNFTDLAEHLVFDPRPSPAPADQEPTLIDVIEEVTGFLPLHVYQLCLAVKAHRQGDATVTPDDVRDCVSALSRQLREDVDKKVASDFFQGGKADYLEQKISNIAKAAECNYGFKNQIFFSKQVDWRYFYPEGEDMVAKPVSELARVAVIGATVAASMKLAADKRNMYLQSHERQPVDQGLYS